MDILAALNELELELVELYKKNGRNDYDSGRIDGVRQAIEVVQDLK